MMQPSFTLTLAPSKSRHLYRAGFIQSIHIKLTLLQAVRVSINFTGKLVVLHLCVRSDYGLITDRIVKKKAQHSMGFNPTTSLPCVFYRCATTGAPCCVKNLSNIKPKNVVLTIEKSS